MRLATLKRGGRDGTLVAGSDDGARVAPVTGYATRQAALDDWDAAQDALTAAVKAAASGEAVAPDDFAAPRTQAVHRAGRRGRACRCRQYELWLRLYRRLVRRHAERPRRLSDVSSQ